jgi:hypothetical protein
MPALESMRYLGICVLLLGLLTPVFAADRAAHQTETVARALDLPGVLAYDWSPDRQTLVYVTREGIWKVRGPDFDRPERLVRKGKCMGAGLETPQIRWSPDGKKFVFLDSRPVDEWTGVWVANADGSNVRELLPGWDFSYNSMRGLRLSEWASANELSLFFRCGPGCRALGLVSMKAGQRPICLGENRTGAASNIMAPEYSWSPSRRWVVAERNDGELGLLDVHAAKVGSPVREIEDHRFLLPACGVPSLNSRVPDEDEIVNHFTSWSSNESRGLVTKWPCFKAPVQESSPQLTLWHIKQQRTQSLVVNAGWGAWSPDGKKVAFVVFGAPQFDRHRRIVGTNFQVGQPFQLSVAVMDIITRRVSVVIPLGISAMGILYADTLDRLLPVWSPTGTHLLLTDGREQKFIVRIDGSEQQKLTPSGEGTTTRWSPDGRRVTIHVPRPDPEPDCSQKPVDTFVPPIGKEDMAVSDDEMTKRYFMQRLLTEPELPESLPRYVTFLEAIVGWRTSQEKTEQQRQYFCQGLSEVLESSTWRTRTIPATIAEKYQQRCFKQHASEPPIDTKAAEDFRNAWIARALSRPRGPGVFVPSQATEAARQRETAVQENKEEKTRPILPSLYLVEVGSKTKAP